MIFLIQSIKSLPIFTVQETLKFRSERERLQSQRTEPPPTVPILSTLAYHSFIATLAPPTRNQIIIIPTIPLTRHPKIILIAHRNPPIIPLIITPLVPAIPAQLASTSNS
jgi:hypothetical protein